MSDTMVLLHRLHRGTVFLIFLLCVWVVPQPVLASDDWEHVDTLEAEDPVIRAVWAAFIDRLNSGDADGATKYFVPEERESMSEIYKMIGDSIQEMPDHWSDLAEPTMYGPFVSYKFMDESSKQIYSVTFLKMLDGQWLIKSL